jgi:FkbM family methyltransferase
MPSPRASAVDPLLVRTRLLRLATRRADQHARIVALGERSRAARVAAAPVRWWMDRGPIVVGEGLGYDLRLYKADLPLDHAHAGLIVRGALERPVQEALRRLLAPGMTVWDVGANVGFFSLVCGRLVAPAGRVVAFEPVGASAAAIRRNAELNGLGGVIEAREAAVWSESGRGELLVVADRSWSHLAATGHHAQTRAEVAVELVAADDLVAAGEPPPDVVKVDVEGAEIQVLDGMERVLREHGPVLVIELHETNRAVAERLRAAGYTMENLDGPEPIEDAAPDVHVLARRRSV